MPETAAYTTVHHAWFADIHWIDGDSVLRRSAEIQLPCVWLVNPDAAKKQLGAVIPDLLNESEKSRANRFHRQEHKERFEIGHAILRTVLGRVLGTNPTSIAFKSGHHGKPLLETPGSAPIAFNLSYTENRILLGIGVDHPIGVDIEWLQRPIELHTMLDACFSAREINFITSDRTQLRFRFFTLWTRKEAILKLTGEGIGEHLPYFEVLDGVCVNEKRHLGGTLLPDTVCLYSFPIGTDYIGCVATSEPKTKFYFYEW